MGDPWVCCNRCRLLGGDHTALQKLQKGPMESQSGEGWNWSSHYRNGVPWSFQDEVASKSPWVCGGVTLNASNVGQGLAECLLKVEVGPHVSCI